MRIWFWSFKNFILEIVILLTIPIKTLFYPSNYFIRTMLIHWLERFWHKQMYSSYSKFLISGNIFNIPVGIFLLDSHPYNPPIVYIKPTNTMVIKQGLNVDVNGKVDLPYLRDWRYVSKSYNVRQHAYK